MDIILWIGIFIISLAVLLKASNIFIDAAERIGLYFDIEPFIIGVFVLGFGTSIPELTISLISVFQNASEVVVGNVIGSNITNIFLILGIAAIIVKKSKINFDFLEFDLPLFITTAFLLGVTIWDRSFSFIEAVFFLGILAIYIGYTVSNHKKKKPLVPAEVKEEMQELKERPRLTWRVFTEIIVAPVFIFLGAKYTVEAVLWFSSFLHVGSDIVAATVIALGTSLPELSISYVTLKKGKIDEMLGNVIGSNIFNILAVMAIPALFHALLIPEMMLSIALPLMLLATAIAFVVIRDKQITRWEGIILLIFYVFYIGRLFITF